MTCCPINEAAVRRAQGANSFYSYAQKLAEGSQTFGGMWRYT